MRKSRDPFFYEKSKENGQNIWIWRKLQQVKWFSIPIIYENTKHLQILTKLQGFSRFPFNFQRNSSPNLPHNLHVKFLTVSILLDSTASTQFYSISTQFYSILLDSTQFYWNSCKTNTNPRSPLRRPARARAIVPWAPPALTIWG